MIFRYKDVTRPDGTHVRCPVIPIRIIKETKGETSIDTLALLDSGADISAISKEMAETLGLDLSAKKQKGFGVGGSFKTKDSRMTINILSKSYIQLRYRIPVKIIYGNYELPVLLGRLGLFDKFKITFDQKSEKVIMRKIN